MYFHTASVLTAALVAVLFQHAPDPAEAQAVAGLRVRVDALKKSSFEQTSAGPVLVGPQSALDLEWRVLNASGDALEIPSPAAFLRLRVSGQEGQIPVRMEWEADMRMRARANGELLFSTQAALGPALLAEGASLWVRGSTKRVDGAAFAPGDYVLELDVSQLQHASAGVRTAPPVDRGFPIQLRILDLNTPGRRRQFHILEGGFYERVDSSRALKHYAALESLPDAPWSDSLPLARMYGELGRHREASAVFRRILPDLIRALDSPLGDIVRTARHLRRAAMSIAVEGDVATASNLLRLEGRTPEARIPGEIEQLRKSAPKPRRNPQ